MKRSTKERIRKSRLWRKGFTRKTEPNLLLTNYIHSKEVIKEMPIKFDDIKGYDEEDFKLPLLQETFLNKKIFISAVRFGTGQFGEYAVITVGEKEFRTSAIVLLKHLHIIHESIEELNDVAEVTIKKVKNYYKFE